MQLALKQDMINRLLALPESGMGYQIVDLVLSDGRVISNVPVVNCEIANVPDSFDNVRSTDVVDVRMGGRGGARR